METITTAVGTSGALVTTTAVSAWGTLNAYFVGLGCSAGVATGLSVVSIAAGVIGVFFIAKYIWNGIKNLWNNRGVVAQRAANVGAAATGEATKPAPAK